MNGDTGDYKVTLPVYQGPLDLLLFLIHKDEIDIYDIPIADITEQYMRYLHLMQELNLAVAGDFFVMAATLMEIKSAMLLPRGSSAALEDVEDPRATLVERLIEYKKYREAARELADLEFHQIQKFPAGGGIIDSDGDEEYTEPLSAFLLLSALQEVLDRYREPELHIPGAEGPTLEEQIEYITGELSRSSGAVKFTSLLHTSRVFIVVTFLALLELLKRRQIRVVQEGMFSEIYIQTAESI